MLLIAQRAMILHSCTSNNTSSLYDHTNHVATIAGATPLEALAHLHAVLGSPSLMTLSHSLFL
jgi:hypothetical protein